MCKDMSATVIEPFKQVLEGLNRRWSSSAATQMQKELAPFREWLDTLGEQLHATHKAAKALMEAYVMVHGNVVPLAVVKANRDEQESWQRPPANSRTMLRGSRSSTNNTRSTGTRTSWRCRSISRTCVERSCR